MIFYQQGISLPQKRRRESVADPVEGASSTSAVPTISIIQVSNIQDLPSANKKQKVGIRELAPNLSISRQKEVLPTLLYVLLSEQKLSYDENQIAKMDECRCIEKLHYRDFVYWALQTESALLHLKTKVVEFLALKKAKALSTQTSNVRGSIQKAIGAFFNTGMNYFSLSDKLSTEEKFVPPPGDLALQKTNARNRLRYIKKTLQEKEDSYAKLLEEKGFFSYEIENYIRDSIIDQKYTIAIQRALPFFSFAELYVYVKNFFELTEKKYIFEPAFIPEELEFKKERNAVPETFWESLDVQLSPKEYTTKFHQFLLTNWKSESLYKIETSREKINTKDILEDCLQLSQDFFRKNMESHAASFIRHILNIKEKQLEIDLIIENKTGEEIIIQKKISLTNSIYYLRTIIQDDFELNYTDYQKRKFSLPILSKTNLKKIRAELCSLKKTPVKNILRERSACRLTLNNNLKYISQVLNFIREKPNFDDKELINLVRFYLQPITLEQTSSNPKSIENQNKHLFDVNQDGSEPSAKKRAVATSQNLVERLEPSRMQKQVSLNEMRGYTAEPDSRSSLLAPNLREIQSTSETDFTSPELNLMMHQDVEFESSREDLFLLGEIQQISSAIQYEPISQAEQSISNISLQFPDPTLFHELEAFSAQFDEMESFSAQPSEVEFFSAQFDEMESFSAQASALSFETSTEFGALSAHPNLSFDGSAQVNTLAEIEDFGCGFDVDISDIDLSLFNEFE